MVTPVSDGNALPSAVESRNNAAGGPYRTTTTRLRPSISSVLSVLFVLYICHSLWSMYKIYYPTPCPVTESCIQPSWDKSTRFQLAAFVSTKRTERRLNLIWSENNVDISSPFEVVTNITLPQETLHNGSLYLYVYLCETRTKDKIMSLSQFDTAKTSTKHASVTKFVVPKSKPMSLLGSEEAKAQPGSHLKHKNKPVTHWIPRILVHIMSEPLPLSGIPQDMFSHFLFTPKRKYLPMLHLDHFGILEKDFWPVNSSSKIMPLTLSFVPVSLGKLRLMVIVEQSLKMLESAGFSDKETDDVKSIFFDTNIYLLFLTFIVSGFHLLFDLLAFKNDISFWRKRKSLVGLSFRSLIWRCVSQSIVFVYLADQGTSLLVLIPAVISILIDLWKVSKALKLNIIREGWKIRLEFGAASEEEKQSDAYDSQGMKYLMWLVIPCCLSYAAYSLLYIKHASWFSWCLETVVNGVYAFGFIFMMPQLFVNYKLKSVAHLPWRVFMYKAFNTVVDDLFAFIITMPTAHRIACFRDDIVFVVYLYQRWLYPVDKTRATEYSETSEPSGKFKEE